MAQARAFRKALPAACVVALALSAAVLGGCTSVLSELPTAVGGLPAGAPERPAETASFPPVHDAPPARPPVLSPAERKKTTDELAATRDEQAKRAVDAAKAE